MPTKRNVKPVSAKPATVANAPAKAAVLSTADIAKLTAAIGPNKLTPAAPVAAKPATDAAQAAQPRGLVRDAAGIVRGATFFNQYSDRDTAYLAFFGAVCRQHAGSATLRQIHDAGTPRSGDPATSRKRYNPNYNGSGKATDVGAVNRLIKAGYFTRSADGNTITATKLATDSAAYRGSKPV